MVRVQNKLQPKFKCYSTELNADIGVNSIETEQNDSNRFTNSLANEYFLMATIDFWQSKTKLSEYCVLFISVWYNIQY